MEEEHEIIGETRSKGFMAGIELVKEKNRRSPQAKRRSRQSKRLTREEPSSIRAAHSRMSLEWLPR